MIRKRLSRLLALPAVVVIAVAGGSLVAAPAASAAPGDCPDRYVCIFQDTNYTGRMVGYYQGVWTPNVGDYMNDRTSSIINNTDEMYLFFRDSNYGAGTYAVMGRTQVPSMGLSGWNDSITSLRPRQWNDG
ncbi:peptidase inhibitor family I36 protein [Micromonospora matsumotoense]|uniref:peptidase inhibitor family I36 protein n=1 Tax=Micromonospora matsumotoense TaxID=121616 RepID=UPI0033E4307D